MVTGVRVKGKNPGIVYEISSTVRVFVSDKGVYPVQISDDSAGYVDLTKKEFKKLKRVM